MPAGLITVDIEARLAKLEEGVGRANKNLDGFGRTIDRVASRAKTAFAGMAAGIAAGFSVAAFAGMSREIIANAEALQDLSDATGSSVEALSRLNNITKIGGGNFEEIKGALERLAAGMAGVEEGGSKTAEALRFLNIQAKDPAQALEEIAVKLNRFADGASKAAIAKDLFGRSGVGFLATLKDIANNGDVAATVLSKQAEEASKLAEDLRRLQVQSTVLGNAILSDVVPALSTALGEMIEGRRIAGGFFEALRLFGTINPFKELAANIRETTLAIDEANQVSRDDGFIGWLSKVSGNYAGRALQDLNKQLEFLKFQQRTAALALISPANDDARDIRSRMKPDLGYTGGRSKAAAAAVSKVDEFARAIERVAKLAAEADLELSGMFSTQEITGAQKALAALVSSDEWGKFTQPQRDAIEARYKMIDAVQRETNEWGKKRAETDKEIQALRQLEEAQARAVQTFTSDLGQYTDENSAMERSIALIGKDDVARQKLAETIRFEMLSRQALAADDDPAKALARIALIEKEYNKRLGIIDVIAEQTKRLEEVQKFTDIGAQSFSNFLQNLTQGKPLDALKKLGDEFSGRITAVVSDSLSQKLFSKDGALGGFGELLADLFGTSKGATGAAALTGSASALKLSASALSAAAAKLAAASGLSMGGDLFGSLGTKFLPDIIDMVPPVFGVPAFASGTDYVPRTGLALVHQGERITPAAQNRRDGARSSGTGAITVTNNFTLQGPTSRASEQQIAARAHEAIVRAARRR